MTEGGFVAQQVGGANTSIPVSHVHPVQHAQQSQATPSRHRGGGFGVGG